MHPPAAAQEEAEATAAALRDSQVKDQTAAPVTKHATKVVEFDEKAEAEYYKLEQAFKIKLGEAGRARGSGWLDKERCAILG